MATLSTIAMERGTLVVPVSFTDEDSAAVTPDSITWTLLDSDGSVVNSRQDVSVATPAASIEIVLSGADLLIGTQGSIRQLLVEAVFDSDAGNNLPLKQVVEFFVQPLDDVS